MENINTVVTIRKGEGRSLKAGGAWIYDNEVQEIKGSFTNGDIVRVVDFDGYPLGKGCINQNSKIRIRMLTRHMEQKIDASFFYMRVKNAWEYRKSVLASAQVESPDLRACRIIFGEADFLPGLVVDRYEDVLVVESLSLGMDRIKRVILEQLLTCLAEDGITIRGIYERSDAPVRKKEGMLPHKGVLYLNLDGNEQFFDAQQGLPQVADETLQRVFGEIEICENGVRYLVDVMNGQKTGFFLDQKYNRLAMQKLCKGVARTMEGKVRVLDCFTHMGTFALNCGLALSDCGADYDVTGLDISEFAVMQATENAKRNQLAPGVHFRAANVLDELPRLNEAGEKYDVVVLDPPAFTKSKDATKNAMKGYREINMKGMKLVRDGGYLATCSCSHFMTQELFVEVIAQAAKAVHKRLRQVELRTQAPDHPILWAADESYYLKFLIFQVCDEK